MGRKLKANNVLYIYLQSSLHLFKNSGHRAEFRETSGTFFIACSAKFEIARVKRRETIKKMAENGATSTAPCLFHSIQHTGRLGTLGLLKKKYYQAFNILNIFLSR